MISPLTAFIEETERLCEHRTCASEPLLMLRAERTIAALKVLVRGAENVTTSAMAVGYAAQETREAIGALDKALTEIERILNPTGQK